MRRTLAVSKVLLVLIALSKTCQAEDEPMDVEFLEWLGQAADVEELGVDINELLKAQEKKAQSESDESDSK